MRYAVNCSILFTELPLLERPAAAKAAGFDAVEFWWPWSRPVPSVTEVDDFVAAVRDADVSLIGLNFFAGDMAAGDRGLVSWIGREDEFRATVPVAVDIARRTGCTAFNALYGNRQDGQDPAQADALAVQNLLFAARAADQVGGVVLVEPISGSPAYPLKTTAQTRAVVARLHEAGASNVRFLLDLYHLAANGEDLAASIRTVGAESGHCQIADFPGRGEPGSGGLDLQGYLDQLGAVGYDGWVALEYKPTVATAASFGALPELR